MDNEMEVPFGVGEQPTEKIVGFFKGETSEDFIQKEAMTDLVAYTYSLKDTIKELTTDKKTGKYDLALAEIKKRHDADKMKVGDGKVKKSYDERIVVFTPCNGNAKIEWEKWARALIGDKEVDALLSDKEARRESKYIEYAPDYTKCEIL